MTDEDQVAAVVENWRRAEEASDAEGLKALWAQTHSRLTYQPTELEAPLTSFAEISDYYDRACGSVRSKVWRTWDVVVDVLSSNVAFAFAPMDMLFQTENCDEQYWKGRASFIMIKVNCDWKIVHYEDSTIMQYFVPIVYRVQHPIVEKCISHVESGRLQQCADLLHEMLRPIPPGKLAEAMRPPAGLHMAG